jgi:hydrogenase maturation protease
MGDDGIALCLLETIKDELSDTIEIQLWENKDALSITAELLEIKNPIVIVDCADMGLKGGDCRWFNQSECNLEQHLNVLSTHGFGFSEALALAEALGFEQSLFFFAIQPEQLDFGSDISSTLKKKKASIAQTLLMQVQQLKAQLVSE